MPSLKDLLSLAPVPGLDFAVTLLTTTYESIQKISVYRKQCEAMAGRCIELILSVEEGTEGLEGTKAAALAQHLRPSLERINQKVSEWADWGPLKCLLQQGDIRDGIDILQRQLDGAIFHFGVQMNLHLQRTQYETQALQISTSAEFREALQAILDNQNEMKRLLAIPSPQPVEQVMQHLQEELRDPGMAPEQNESFRRGLWELHNKTSKLPPLTDLTGQVELESRHPEFIGSFNDIYQGTWLDKEKVALRLPKTLSDSAIVHKDFQREVSLWRTFDHPNVLPLYGIVYIGKHLYSVSPWMINGTAIGFVQKYPQANVLKMLSEIAEGLAYLHSKGIVHGDLRGANVLISQDGVARLSDFGLSKFLADCNKGLTSLPINPRWFAPEILRDKPLSKQSDIWALGMTFLELLTGQQPFGHIGHDLVVLDALNKGKTPNRPTSPAVIDAGLNDDMWALLKGCWKKPDSRPTIEEIKQTLAHIRGEAPEGASNGRRGRLSFIPGRKKSEPRPTTATSMASSNSSSSSSGRLRSLTGLTINTIQERYQDLSPLSAYSGSLPSSYSPNTTTSPLNAYSPNRRRPSQASESSNDNPAESNSSFFATRYHDAPRIDISRAPKLELQHLESPNSPVDRTRLPPPRSQTLGSISANARSIMTVESVNLEPLLQQAISDKDRIVYTNGSGIVVAGTLEGLVDRLVDNFNLRKDEEYREVILTACIDFITPEDLFLMLQWRFDEAEQETHKHPADRVATQYNVFMVISYWLTRRQLPVDSQLLWQMREFCETAIRMKASSTMVDKAMDILQLIDDRPKQDAIPRTPLVPGRRMLTASEVSPEGLAIALTLLEGDRYRQIMPCDYLANQCGRPGYNNVDAACSVTHKIILWIKQSLLYYDALQSRAAVLKFFINTANECRKLRNYQSLIAIAIALDSAPVQSLDLTKNYLSAKMVAQLEALVKLPLPENNHARYREALQEVIDPAYRDYCIPWIAVHLKELHSVLHMNKRVVEIKGRPLINFQRYTKFMDRVREIFPLPPPDLERYRQQGQLAYLEEKLATVKLEENVEDELVKRSQAVRATEEVLGRHRIPERERLGFTIPKSMRPSVSGAR